jgi:NmrA-like family
VRAAREARVEHLIWSTLPDVENLTGGRRNVLHFSGKAHVDAVVRSAGFTRHTFVEAPFYFQNFLGVMAPQPLPGGMNRI